MIEEKDILAYLDQNSSAELTKRVESWINETDDNREEFEFTKMMWEESQSAADYVQFDVSQEWEIFESNIQTVVSEKPKFLKLEKRTSWRTSLSIAASVAVLVAATWLLWPQSEYIEIVNAPSDTELLLDDGSVVKIKQGANFKTKRSYKYESKRNVEIAGEVNFDIAPDPDRPFIVNTEETAVEVLGTVFNVITEGVESEVANEEGLVKFFVIEDPSQFRELAEGEVFKYDGEGFIDLTPRPEPEPEPRIIPKVQDIISYLKTISGGRVTFGSGINENSLAELDIDYEGKTVRQVIRLMQEKAIVPYISKGCANCLEITEIIPRKR